MNRNHSKKLAAGVLALQLALQANAVAVPAFAEGGADTAAENTEAVQTTETQTPETAETETEAETEAEEEIEVENETVPEVYAADDLTVSGGTSVPSSLAQGRLVNVKGTITSGTSNITSVTVGVYDANNTRVTGGTVAPNARSYDLARLDNYVAFDKLAAGSYTYKVIATNGSHTNYTVNEQSFTVTAASASATDSLSISGVTAIPDSIAEGAAVAIQGMVNSASSDITYLTVGVYDANGKFITGRTISPKVTSYDLRRLDSYIEFDSLTTGTYTFAVIATNSANTNYALVNKKFTVTGSVSTTSVSDSLSISGGTEVPATLNKGAILNINGIVSSASSNITALTAGVYDSAGKFVTGRTVAPNTKSYDLHNLDNYIAFNTLAAGTYTYAVIASNAANTNYALVSKKFTISDGGNNNTAPSSTNDALSISGGTVVPDTLNAGGIVNVKGTVTSASSNITALTVGVYDSAGKFVTGRTIAPNAKTYDLSRLDNYVAFNTLAAGKYVYAVIATNATNSNYSLVSKTFTVGASNNNTTPATGDALSISGGTAVPETLNVGGILNVTGTVTSASSNITSLTVGVYDSAGKFVTGRTIAPNAKSYDLRKLDNYVAFNRLAAGKYTYAVIASNASNTNFALVSKSFNVGSGGTSTPSASDALTITGGTTMPGTVNKGSGVIVRGTVSSASSNITSLTVGVYNSSNQLVTGTTVTPGASSYNLNRADSSVRFDRLDAGTYTYKVIATNGANSNYTLTSQSFTVR